MEGENASSKEITFIDADGEEHTVSAKDGSVYGLTL